MILHRATILRIVLIVFCVGLFTHTAASLSGQSSEKKTIRQNKRRQPQQTPVPGSENAQDDQDTKPKKSPFEELQDPEFGDPEFGDPEFDDELTPEEAAAAQGAVGCMTCGCCGFYGAFFFIWLVALIAGVGIQIFLTVFVYNDATKNQVDNPGLWALVTFFLGVIGFLIYFFTARNNRRTQPPLHPPVKPPM